MSRKSVTTRVPKNCVKSERLPKVSRKSVKKACQASASSNSVSHECCAIMSSKSVPPDCQISVSCQSVPQLCPVENVISIAFLHQQMCQHGFLVFLHLPVGQGDPASEEKPKGNEINRAEAEKTPETETIPKREKSATQDSFVTNVFTSSWLLLRLQLCSLCHLKLRHLPKNETSFEICGNEDHL